MAYLDDNDNDDDNDDDDDDDEGGKRVVDRTGVMIMLVIFITVLSVLTCFY